MYYNPLSSACDYSDCRKSTELTITDAYLTRNASRTSLCCHTDALKYLLLKENSNHSLTPAATVYTAETPAPIFHCGYNFAIVTKKPTKQSAASTSGIILFDSRRRSISRKNAAASSANAILMRRFVKRISPGSISSSYFCAAWE